MWIGQPMSLMIGIGCVHSIQVWISKLNLAGWHIIKCRITTKHGHFGLLVYYKMQDYNQTWPIWLAYYKMQDYNQTWAFGWLHIIKCRLRTNHGHFGWLAYYKMQ